MWAAGNIIIGGLITGAIYALLAVGYSLVFSVSGALNLAQGAFVALGALTMYTFEHNAHLPVLVAFLAALAVVAVAIGIIEWVVIRPAVTRISHANLLMMMGGLLTAFEGAAFLIWGSNPFSTNPFSGSKPVHAGGLSIPTQGFWVIGAMLAAVVGLSWLLSRSRWGRGLRATSENMTAARLMGVPVDRMILLSFVAAAALGVIAGAVISPLTSLDYTSMASYTNEGLIAVSLGGLGSVYGSVAGGLVLGVVEAVVSGYVSSLFSTAISLIILIGIIFLRPQGLLGRVRGARIDVAERTSGRIYAPPRLPRYWARAGGAALALVMLFVPDIIPAGDMRALNITGIFCLTIVGLDLLTGIAGQVSLGQAGFMAIGGYMFAILTVKYHWPTLLGLLIGMVGSALVATVLGLVCGRLRGMYLAITTLAFGILVEAMANGLSITGGPSGIGGIPVFSVAGFAFDSDTRFFYLIWALVAVALIAVANFVRSNRGRILRAMHGDQAGARSLGLNITRAKISVFVISACLASIAGSLYASYFRYLSPDQVGSSESLQLITMLVIGGMGTLFGPLIGVALLTYLPLESQSIANYSMLLTGVLLVLFLRYLPAGIWGGVLEVINRLVPGRKPAAAPDVGAEAPGSTEASEVVSMNGHGLAGRAGGPDAGAGRARADQDVRRGAGRAQRQLQRAGRLADRADRAQRRGQVHGVQPGHQLVPARQRRGRAGRAADHQRPARAHHLLGLFRTFQTARVFPQLSVLDNVLVGGYRLGRAGYLAQALRLPKCRREERELDRRARHLLEVMGLADRAEERAAVLPLAAQKYLELARSLMARPSVVLFDEPGAGMNDAETAELGMILRAIRDTGHTVLVVEHNMSLVMGVCDHVVVMDAGRVIAAGPPREVSHDPVVIGAYFGAAEASA